MIRPATTASVVRRLEPMVGDRLRSGTTKSGSRGGEFWNFADKASLGSAWLFNNI